MALSTVSGILTRIGMGRLGRLGLEPAERYERERPGELIHIDVKKLGRIQGGYGKRITGNRRQPTTLASPTPPVGVTSRSAGNTSTSPSTTRPAWPTSRSSPTRRRRPRSASSPEPSRTSPATASPSKADHRQRLRLPLSVARDRLPHPRHPPPANASLPTADQRQSRALHPHHARRLGLRRDLPRQPRTHRRPQRLARFLQSPTTTRRPRPPSPLARLHERNNLLGSYT